MKKVFSLLLLISFAACSSEQIEEENDVSIFNGISFKMIEGENLTEMNQQVKEDYLTQFQPSHFQIPLFKSIQNKDYNIYLGLPFNTSLAKLVHYEQIDVPFQSQSDSTTYFFKKHHNDTTFISEYAEVFDGNLIYVLATTKSELIADSLFNQMALSNRFNQIEK